MNLVKIQTNRARLRKLIGEFSFSHAQGEYLVAPRPLPKEIVKYYIAFACVSNGSKAESTLQSVNNYVVLSKDEFLNLLEITEYYWFAGDKEAYNERLQSDRSLRWRRLRLALGSISHIRL